jgi:hypothetical protein
MKQNDNNNEYYELTDEQRAEIERKVDEFSEFLEARNLPATITVQLQYTEKSTWMYTRNVVRKERGSVIMLGLQQFMSVVNSHRLLDNLFVRKVYELMHKHFAMRDMMAPLVDALEEDIGKDESGVVREPATTIDSDDEDASRDRIIENVLQQLRKSATSNDQSNNADNSGDDIKDF